MPQNPKATAGADFFNQPADSYKASYSTSCSDCVCVCVCACVFGGVFLSACESVFMAIFSVFVLDLHLHCLHFLAGDSPSSCLACAIQSYGYALMIRASVASADCLCSTAIPCPNPPAVPVAVAAFQTALFVAIPPFAHSRS
jgi:hypothetical protein